MTAKAEDWPLDKPFKWEAELAVITDHRCESDTLGFDHPVCDYGIPVCGNPPVFCFERSRYPNHTHSCRKHVYEMAVLGRPKVIQTHQKPTIADRLL